MLHQVSHRCLAKNTQRNVKSLRSNHNGECQLPKKDDNISGPENMIVSESCWCIKGINDDGTAAVDNGGGNWVPCTQRLNSIRKLVAFFVYLHCLLMHSESSYV